jgi:arylsulfatase A-like enzyme
MRRFHVGRPCRDVRPWSGPAFDEADVSDKPAYVRATPRIGTRWTDLRSRCEAAMTTDYVASEVRAALEETGRLANTLFVLTADNGTLLGDHRLRSKGYPYATPLPLYMSWPARLNGKRHVIREPVSNVDLAPTFCALAGCTVPDADGLDLMPLLAGDASLDRDFVYEEMLHGDRRYGVDPAGRPAWYGIRTTAGYDDRRWVYTEYETGEVELYDLSADPYQLENLAGRPGDALVEASLRALLHDRVITPDEVRFIAGPVASEEE